MGGNYTAARRESVRKRLAAHLGCFPADLALTRNATDGVVAVIFGFPLDRGDEILTTTREHAPYYGALAQRASRGGIAIRRIGVPSPARTPEEIADTFDRAISPRTRLIMVSHIGLSGQIFPIRRIVEIARRAGAQVLVDGVFLREVAARKLNVPVVWLSTTICRT